MLRAIKSELIRLNKPSFLFGGIGLMAGAAILATLVSVSQAGNTGPGPGQWIPTEAALAAKDGFTSGLPMLANVVGVVALSFWAIAVALDYQTGLIRLLVQAEPSRLRLLGGKLVALVLYTLAATFVATLAASLAAYALAPAFGFSTAAWGTDTLLSFGEAYLHLALSAMVWGIIGLTIATVSRSSGLAIAIGIGYVLIVEQIVSVVAQDAADILPGAALTALAAGGTPNLEFGSALGLGVAYFAAGLIISAAVMQRREITY